jgi:hypothetical protein
MTGELLIKKQNHQSLDDFVAVLSGILGCGPWEERESSNYPPEFRYFRCYALGMEITASIADKGEFSAFEFLLFLEPELLQRERAFLAGVADCIAKKLVLAGYEVLRPFDSSRVGNGGVYRLDPTAGEMPWEKIVTHEIGASQS